MKNIKALFNHRLSVLSNLLVESHLQDDPALWLYQNDARTALFYLEGMCRALATMHNPKRFTKLTDRFKSLEDALGQFDYADALVKEFSANPAIPKAVIEHLSEQRQSALLSLNELLEKDGWVGESAQRINKIRKTTKKIDWQDDNELVSGLRQLYENDIAEIDATLNKPFESIENDLHELRRDVRWLSIYPQAFKGYIVLANPRRIIAKKFDKYRTEAVLNSPFNQLPRVDDITAPLLLNPNNFYAVSWFISASGILKDQGLRLDALTHAIHVTQEISPESAQAQALSLLGSQQASTEEILMAAEIITKQFKADGIFSGLLA